MPIQKLDKCLPEKLQGADRARHYLAIVDFRRKQKKGETPRERERERKRERRSVWGNRRKTKGRDISMERRRRRKEKGGTLLSWSIGLLPLFSPCIQPHCIGAWGCGVSICPPSDPLRAAHTPRPLERLLFVQSCARNIAAAGQPRRPLQQGKKEEMSLAPDWCTLIAPGR